MTDQQIKDAIRGFIKSSSTGGDTKQALTFFADDAEWETPQGTFKGIAQIEKFMTWLNKTAENKITETGMGIIVEGDTGVIEHKLSGTFNGRKWESPAVCIYEFKNGKIARLRAFYDVLSQAQQVTKGVSRWVVNMVVNASQKGLK
jgi:uncharacterized protein